MKIVHLTAVRGKELFDENGNLISEKDKVKIIHYTQEWFNFIKNLGRFDYSKIKITKVVERNQDELYHARKMRDELKRDFSANPKDIRGWEDKIKKIESNLDKEIDTSEIQAEVNKAFIESRAVKKPTDNVDVLKAENESLVKRLEKLEALLGGKSGSNDNVVDEVKNDIDSKSNETDLSKMNVSEIKKFAESNQIKIPKDVTKKPDIIDFVEKELSKDKSGGSSDGELTALKEKFTELYGQEPDERIASNKELLEKAIESKK